MFPCDVAVLRLRLLTSRWQASHMTHVQLHKEDAVICGGLCDVITDETNAATSLAAA